MPKKHLKDSHMKSLSLLLALLLSSVASAVDYNIGQCPVAPNCNLSAQPANASTYSDTFTFVLGNWQEYYGTYDYTSSLDVIVTGASGITPCGGRGCHGQPYSVTVDSATLDGVPMTQISAKKWQANGSLSPGTHVIAVTGTATGATWYGRESAAVQGIQYTLVANPPCQGCGE
jgi:hypothetical protein